MIQTDLPFHPWIGSNPMKHLEELKTQERKWDLLTKISYVAIGAISFNVFVSSLFLGPITGTAMTLTLLGSILATPCISWGASRFQENHRKIVWEIEKETPIAKIFSQIKDLGDEYVLQFLEKHQISLQTAPLPHLPPLIARFEVNSQKAAFLQNRAQEMLIKAAFLEDRELRQKERAHAWDILEKTALPALLEAAFTLQILKNPTLQGGVKDHFCLIQNSFEERQFDRLYGPDDHYLLFFQENRAPRSLEYMMSHTPDEILSSG